MAIMESGKGGYPTFTISTLFPSQTPSISTKVPGCNLPIESMLIGTALESFEQEEPVLYPTKTKAAPSTHCAEAKTTTSIRVNYCSQYLMAAFFSQVCRLGFPFRRQRAFTTAHCFEFEVQNEKSMQELAATSVEWTKSGDVYCLYGTLGAGKSLFCRSFIKRALNDPRLAVPSPTFVLENQYYAAQYV